jgi:transposase
MAQLHNNFNDEQIKQFMTWYQGGEMTRDEITSQLGIKQSQFYALLAKYKQNPSQFTITYGRNYANRKLNTPIIQHIRRELEIDKRLIDNPNMPIMFYNYASVRDAVAEKTGYDKLSAQTVINYAKKWGYYIERPKNKRVHTREVLTDYVGMLLQHDASLHQWSPYAVDDKGKAVKWSLITTLDDHSRKLLYAELFERETAWAHIQALESVVLDYGVGLRYYSDNHAIFRYVANRDQDRFSAANLNRLLDTDDVAPQWKQCVEATGMSVTYALSPEAKGKIERPYRWLQERIVRRSAREGAKTINEVRQILYSEIDRYNNRQVHSSTKEIPGRRFQTAVDDGRSCFKVLDLEQTKPPVTSSKDLFCLRTERKVDGYGQVSLYGQKLSVPGHLADRTSVALHIVPGEASTEVRFLSNGIVLGYTNMRVNRKT